VSQTAGCVVLRPLLLSDYAAAIRLWQQSDGVQLRDADSEPAIARYLARNPGLSFAAERNGVLVGTVLAGHDGRRGYLHHLAVDTTARRSGIASVLVDAALTALRREGIGKVHIMVLATNAEAQSFWCARGFGKRGDITLLSYTAVDDTNA
jgi:N-acetylglutamate synthase